MAVLTSDKIEFKTKILQELKRHFIMRKMSMYQYDITMINTYTHLTSEHQNTWIKTWQNESRLQII